MAQEPNPSPRTSSRKWLILAVATVVVGGVAAFAALQDTSSNANGNANRNLNSSANTNTASNTNTDPLAGWKSYHNPTYGYSVQYPQDWRLAERYMAAYAAIRNPGKTSSTDDYVVITNTSSEDELAFVANAQANPGIASRPWLDFGLGQAVVIQPSTSSRDEYTKPVPPGTDTVTVTPSNVRDVTLSSGVVITRLTRYVSDNNGSFTYDVALFPTQVQGFRFFEVRIEKHNNDYEAAVFGAMLETFTAP